MNHSELISEEDAVILAQISPKTLARFADAGYLKVKQSGEGPRKFIKSELCQVFGLQLESRALKVEEPEALEAEVEVEESQKTVQSLREKIKISIEPSVEMASDDLTDEPAPVIENSAAFTDLPIVEGNIAIQSDKKVPEQDSALKTVRFNRNYEEQLTKAKADVERLSKLSELQERLLDERDAEVRDLREQRQWLRERIEKLEDKADRDQMLLLSETRMMSQLVLEHTQKKSVFREVLEWFGVLDEKTQTHKALQSPSIEISKKD